MQTPQPEYVVPVVAHRLFGRNYPDIRIEAGFPDEDDIISGEPRPGFVVRGTIGENPPVIDHSRGTQRSWQEIDAMFTAAPEVDGTDGSTVNDLWADTGIRFELVEKTDTPISSAMAQHLSPDTAIVNSLLRPVGREGVINLYFARRINGAWGFARPYYPARAGHIPIATIADLRDRSENPDTQWKHSLITLAHEFGHVLGLGHVAFDENIMYGHGTLLGSLKLDQPQAAICRNRAAYLSGAVSPPASRRAPRM